MILMIDDEKRTLDSYLQELALSDFMVRYESSVDAGLKCLEENVNEIELLILDLMMPYGQAFNEDETEKGLRTGIVFYERVRKANAHLPVMILTNNVDEGIRRVFEQEPHCRFFRKEDLLPFELADAVKDFLQTENQGRQTS